MIIIMGILLLYRMSEPSRCYSSYLFRISVCPAGIYLIQGSISLSRRAGVVVLGMAMSYSIHVLTHFLECLSARSVVMHLSRPLDLGGLTTIGAFLSLLFTESEILNDLGLFAALTLVGATCSADFLPHLLPKSMTPAAALSGTAGTLQQGQF
jgi:predicted exporter